MRTSGIAIALASASLLLLVTSSPVAGDPWGTNDASTGTGPHPDENPHTYCYSSSVGSDLRTNIENAEWNALDITDANVNYQASCTTSGASETDVVWRQADLTPGTSGETYCDDFESDPPTNQCDQAYSSLDLAEINYGAEDEIDQTQTACHELGHTVGLTHGGASTDCMINSGDTPPTALQYRRYGPEHHAPDHINNWF